MFCGSFHACATNLNISQHAMVSGSSRSWVVLYFAGRMRDVWMGKGTDSLGMAASSHELFLFVREADRGVREGFTDCEESGRE